jgi:hypothetical protein
MVRSLGNCDTKTARLLAHQLFCISEQIFETARAKPIGTYMRSDAGLFRHTAESMPFPCGKAAMFRNMAPEEVIAAYERFP